MIFTKTDVQYIVPFLLFVGLGMWGSFHFPFREDKNALTLAFKWFLLPSLVFGGLYAYYAGYKRSPKQATWRKFLAVIVLTFIMTLIFVRSFQGFIFLINGYIGEQSDVNVSGLILKVDKPKAKKPLNSYTIYVKGESGNELVLDVPGIHWNEGELFSKNLRSGSLGILYGN